ncbi:TPA: hypothetical protein L3N15_004213 [Vibrio parahaemolyticus]|nr:hypothetical protein [Vibrio parahaemolyticus]
MKKSAFAPGAKLQMDNTAAIIAKLSQERNQPAQVDTEIAESLFFESVTDDMFLEAVSKTAETNLRSNAAASVMTWIDEGDASFEELDALIYGFAAGDDEELDDDELEDYNAMMNYAYEFLVSNGADAAQVQSMEENEDASEAVFNAVKESTKAKDDAELIADFSVRETMMLEAKKKVVRDGEVTYVKKKTKKHRQTPAQKASLKKAQKKSNTSAAKAKRRKSNRVRKSHGMK